MVTTSPNRRFTLSGLTDGHQYGVRIRATNSSGVSIPVTGYGDTTPYTRPGEPTAVKAEARPSALAVSWAPPTVPGTYPLTGYTVFVMRADSTEDDPGPTWQCTTDAAARSCVLGVEAGQEYVAFVSAVAGKLGAHINEGDPAFATSGVVPLLPVAATVPQKDGDLLGAGGALTTVTAGKTVVLKGTGFAPNSTVQATVYSTPTALGSYLTDDDGAFEISVTVPQTLVSGNHTLVVSGVDEDGDVRNVLAAVTVAGGAAPALATTGNQTGNAAGAATGQAARSTRLASTGADIALPVLGGLIALSAGGGLLVAARRRTAG